MGAPAFESLLIGSLFIGLADCLTVLREFRDALIDLCEKVWKYLPHKRCNLLALSIDDLPRLFNRGWPLLAQEINHWNIAQVVRVQVELLTELLSQSVETFEGEISEKKCI